MCQSFLLWFQYSNFSPFSFFIRHKKHNFKKCTHLQPWFHPLSAWLHGFWVYRNTLLNYCSTQIALGVTEGGVFKSLLVVFGHHPIFNWFFGFVFYIFCQLWAHASKHPRNTTNKGKNQFAKAFLIPSLATTDFLWNLVEIELKQFFFSGSPPAIMTEIHLHAWTQCLHPLTAVWLPLYWCILR